MKFTAGKALIVGAAACIAAAGLATAAYAQAQTQQTPRGWS